MALRCLTFEVRRDRRWDARPGPQKMYRVPPDRAWWSAVGPRLDRGVRPRLGLLCQFQFKGPSTGLCILPQCGQRR